MADVLLVAVVFFLALILLAAGGMALAPYVAVLRGLSPTDLVSHPLFFVPLQLFAYLLTYVFTRMYIELRTDQDFWPVLQWNFPHAMAFAGCALGGVALALVVQLAGTQLPMPEDPPILRYFRDPQWVPLIAVLAVLAAPLAEEIFFRGLLYPAFRNLLADGRSIALLGTVALVCATAPFAWVYIRYATISKLGIALVALGGLLFAMAARARVASANDHIHPAAIMLTAAAFAIVHEAQVASSWGPLLILFVVGLAFTIVRARLHSVAASWTMHTTYNLSLFVTYFATRA